MPKRAEVMQAYQLRRIKTPGIYFVGVVPGLFLRWRSETNMAWRIRVYLKDGPVVDIGLGPYPAITLEKARELGRELYEQAKSGVDPRKAKQAAVQTAKADAAKRVTFKDAAESCLAKREKELANRKHFEQWCNTLSQYAYPKIGDLYVLDISPVHVVGVLQPIWETINETASRLRGRIEKVIDHAHALLEVPIQQRFNPARWEMLKELLVEPGLVQDEEHHPAIPWTRIGEFMPHLQADPTVGARCLEYLTLTVARSIEVRGARWPEIDFDRREWTIPIERMKIKKKKRKKGKSEKREPHRVPLSDEAIRLLQSLPRFEGTDLIFPGPRTGKVMSDNTLLMVVKRTCEKLPGNPPATPHGMRSAFKDWHRTQPGYEDETSEIQLAHVSTDKTRAAYARDQLFAKRSVLMQQWARFCYEPPRASNVVQLLRAAS